MNDFLLRSFFAQLRETKLHLLGLSGINASFLKRFYTEQNFLDGVPLTLEFSQKTVWDITFAVYFVLLKKKTTLSFRPNHGLKCTSKNVLYFSLS